jgi:hypothetical protein
MLEPISFTKVFFIDPQLNWGIFHAYSAPFIKKNPCIQQGFFLFSPGLLGEMVEFIVN